MILSFFINTARAVSLPDFQTTQDLGQFISQIYDFSISILGIVIFVRFVWAGWIYLTAAGNSGRVGQAKAMMTNAIIGAVLLLSSYLILYIINPDLVCNTFSFDLLTQNQSGSCPR